MINKIKIFNIDLGYLSWDKSNNHAFFEYDEQIINSNLQVSPICLPLKKGVDSFKHLKNSSFNGLPGLLAESLQGQFSTLVTSEFFNRSNISNPSSNPLNQLGMIGMSGLGALEFEPILLKKGGIRELDLNELSFLSKALYSKEKNLDDFNLNIWADLVANSLLSGSQSKIIASYNQTANKWYSGHGKLNDGCEHYLIKFDVSGQEKRQLEYAYNLMAKDAGINVTEAFQLKNESGTHLVTKRFDRDINNNKLHLQSLSSLTHIDSTNQDLNSYENAFKVIRELRLPISQTEEMFRRMCFNVIAKNHSNYRSNISFLMNENGEWKLAPAYALNYAPEIKDVMSINGKRENIGEKDLILFADNVGIRKSKLIIDQIKGSVLNWNLYAKEASLSPSKTSLVYKDIGVKKNISFRKKR